MYRKADTEQEYEKRVPKTHFEFSVPLSLFVPANGRRRLPPGNLLFPVPRFRPGIFRNRETARRRLRKFLPLDNPAEQPRRCRSRLHRAESCIRPGFLAVFMHAARRHGKKIASGLPFSCTTEHMIPIGDTGGDHLAAIPLSCATEHIVPGNSHRGSGFFAVPAGKRFSFSGNVIILCSYPMVTESLRKSGSPFRGISAMIPIRFRAVRRQIRTPRVPS